MDANGIPVPDEDQVITVEVSGAGTIKGLDNGDLRRTEPHARDTVRTYFGRALAVIQSTRKGGEIEVRVTGEGLAETVVVFQSE